MEKQASKQKSQSENLPALPLDPVIAKELGNTEGVLELDDFTIKMKPREKGFQVSYDTNWQDVAEIPPLILTSSEVYWAQFDGTEYKKRALDDPPPENEKDQWAKYGKLGVFHTKYGRGGFLLAPSGLTSFKAYFQKWKRVGVDIFGKTLRVSSRVTKTQKGYVINVPQFLPGWINGVTSPPEPTNSDPPAIDQADYVLEPDDDIPF